MHVKCFDHIHLHHPLLLPFPLVPPPNSPSLHHVIFCRFPIWEKMWYFFFLSCSDGFFCYDFKITDVYFTIKYTYLLNPFGYFFSIGHTICSHYLIVPLSLSFIDFYVQFFLVKDDIFLCIHISNNFGSDTGHFDIIHAWVSGLLKYIQTGRSISCLLVWYF
jgi:hypothetical protein